jgi:hypothetical protein
MVADRRRSVPNVIWVTTFTFVPVRSPKRIRAWREMSVANSAIVLPMLMFFCYFGTNIVFNWREITTRRAA